MGLWANPNWPKSAYLAASTCPQISENVPFWAVKAKNTFLPKYCQVVEDCPMDLEPRRGGGGGGIVWQGKGGGVSFFLDRC